MAGSTQRERFLRWLTNSNSPREFTKDLLTNQTNEIASFTDAQLEPVRADLFKILDICPNEVVFLRETLRQGQIDGGVYRGECCCLIGTIARGRNCDIADLHFQPVPNSFRPAERWFMTLAPDMTPENNLVAAITDRWIGEWQAQRSLATATADGPAPNSGGDPCK